MTPKTVTTPIAPTPRAPSAPSATTMWLLSAATVLPLGACLDGAPGDAAPTETAAAARAAVDLSDIPVGLYDQTTSQFTLQNDYPGGPDPIRFTFGSAIPTKLPIMGDWDGNGTDTPGVYQQFPSANRPGSYFFLRNSNSTGYGDLGFEFAGTQCSWLCQPLAGRWAGTANTFDTVALYLATSGTFYVRITNDPDDEEMWAVPYRPTGWRSTWRPLAGDFDGDGFDNLALYDPATGTVHVANWSGTTTIMTVQFQPPGWSSAWQPLAGKFDVSQTAVLAYHDRTSRRFHLGTTPPVSFTFGNGVGLAITGDWSRPPPGVPGASQFMSEAEFSATSWLALMGGLHDEVQSTSTEVSPMWRAGNLHSLNEILDAYRVVRNSGDRRIAVFMGTNPVTESCYPGKQTQFCIDHNQVPHAGPFDTYVFDPTSLQRQLELYLDFRTRYPLRPVQLFLNIGAYRGVGPLADYLADLDADRDGYAENAMRDQCDAPYVQTVGWYPYPFRHVSHNQLATEVRRFRRRNQEAAVRFALDYLYQHDALEDLIGFDAGSEVGYGSRYEPAAIKDFGQYDLIGFRQHLQGRFGTIGAVNAAFGTSFASFAAVQPPRCWPVNGQPGRCWSCDGTSTSTNPEGPWNVMDASNPYFTEWSGYRESVLDDYVEFEVANVRRAWDQFIADTGRAPIATRRRVWSHQGAGYDFYSGGSDQVSRTSAGTLGLTIYDPLRTGAIAARIPGYATSDPGWMVGEFNTISNVLADNRAALDLLFDSGAKVVAGSGWNLIVWGDYPVPGSVQVDCFEGVNPNATETRACLPNQVGAWLDIPGTTMDLAIRQMLAPVPSD